MILPNSPVSKALFVSLVLISQTQGSQKQNLLYFSVTIPMLSLFANDKSVIFIESVFSDALPWAEVSEGQQTGRTGMP